MFDVSLLRQENLTDLIREFQPEELLFSRSGLLPVRTQEGNVHGWDVMGIPRDIGVFQGLHSPAGPRNLQIVKQQTAALIRTFVFAGVQGSLLLQLRQPGSESKQRIAEDTIARELRAHAELIMRQDEFLMSQAFTGIVNVTIDKVAHQIDYGFVDTENRNLVIGGAGNNVPVAWSTTTANIIEDVRKLKKWHANNSGFTAKRVWCGSDVIAAMMRNDDLQTFFGGTESGVRALEQGHIAKFMGLEWVAYDSSFLVGSTVTNYIDPNQIIMLPDPNPEWGYMAVGTDVIPKDDKRGMQEVLDMYSYSTLIENPASIGIFAGKVRIPVLRIPKAVSVTKVL
jgi:hypothetical protein